MLALTMKQYDYITEKTVNHLCLCTGYDGVGRGLKRVFPKLRTISYVEIEAFACANLVTKMQAKQMDEAPIFTNLKTFPFGKFRGCVDILSAGFPCQPFSQAGKQKATEDPRHLYPYISDGIALCRPRYVLLENVEGIVASRTADGESVLLYVLKDLERRGYSCAWGTFSAAEVGAPHLRKRIFILAKLGDSQGAGLKGCNLGQGKTQSRGAGSWIMENSDIQGLERSYPIREQDQEGGNSRSTLHNSAWASRYPARPDREQFEWEEPRVVSNSKDIRCGGRKSQDDQDGSGIQESTKSKQSNFRSQTQGCDRDGGTSKIQVESKLGGAVDGATCGLDPTANRVDRLRLLGNGVVPDTCELAIRTLWEELNG